MDEFKLIDKIKRMFQAPEGVLGIGDDCAVLPQKNGYDSLVSTDMLMEGIHFLREDVQPEDLGWKSAAVNISDIAGMGGSPKASFLSFCLPPDLPESWISRFMDGYSSASGHYSCPLLGGDSCSSRDRICISVTVLGECPSGRARKRSDALEGDLICVTGCLGDSAAGLRLVLEAPGKVREGLEGRLVRRHYRPLARVAEGLLLSEDCGVHAMMDISDGTGSDLRHILEESGVSAQIDVEAIPLSEDLRQICSMRGWDPLELALEGGEDYELLFTADEQSIVRLQKKMQETGSCLHVIGRITAGCGATVQWKGSDRDFKGFRHFSDD